MSMWIRAAVTPGRGEPFRIEKVELEDCRPDELIVDIKAAGICHTDEAAQMQQLPVPLPAVLGHEGAGVVAKVGSAVTDFAVGDHVVLSFASCGKCGPCTEGRPYACEKMFEMNFCGMMPDGTKRMYWNGQALGAFFSQSSFATQCVVKARSAVRIDKEINLTVAAPFGCGVQTGAGIVLNCLKPPFGSQLAVFGCGTVGMAALMSAHIAGCKTIIAVGGNAKSLALAKELGATRVFNSTREDIVEFARTLPGGGVDQVFECAGNRVTTLQTCRLIRRAGKVTLVGVSPEPVLELDIATLNAMEGQIFAVYRYRNTWEKCIQAVSSGRIPVKKIVSHVFDFKDCIEAIDYSLNHKDEVIKAVVRM